MKSLLYLLGIVLSFHTFAQQHFQLQSEPHLHNYQIESKSKLTTHLPKTNLRSVSANELDCSLGNYIYCEDFESVTPPALPANISTSSLEDGYNVIVNSTAQDVDGFYTGNSNDANVGGYWPVTEHTQFAMTNDDACKPYGVLPNTNNNCDLSFETMSLPMIDLSSDSNVYLIFDYYHDKNYGGGDAMVEARVGNLSTWTDISGDLSDANAWQEGIVSLDSYSGMDSIFLRFVWSDDNSWATGLAIDNIVVRELEDNNLSFLSYDHYFNGDRYRANYSLIPKSQISVQGVFFSSVIRNVGNNDQDSVRLKVEISSEGYETQSWAKNLESLKRDTFFSNYFFNPSNTGTYSVNFFAESDSTTSDTVNRDVVVTEFIYGRDNDNQSLSFSLASATGGLETIEHGNSFYIYDPIDLYAVDVFIASNSYTNGKIKARVYQLSSGTPLYITESNMLSLFGGIDTWQSVKFPTPVPLESGTEYLVTVGGNGLNEDTTRIGGTSSRDGSYGWRIYNGFIPEGSTSASQDGIYLSIPMVRMNFDPDVEGPISIEEEDLTFFSIYPNPNNGIFSIKYNADIPRHSTLEIHNLLGQTVYDEELKNEHSSQINLSHLEKGLYTASLSVNGKNVQTQKVVIN
jgi:hypothetical protein